MSVAISVLPSWITRLPFQQQSVLILASRGPDGVAKFHACKDVVRAYRGTVLKAAKYGRELKWGEKADTFMSLYEIADSVIWEETVGKYYDVIDCLPHHYHMHLWHGAEILGYKHPDLRMRSAWNYFYVVGARDAHANVETEAEMDARLGDWEHRYWTGE